MLEGRRKGFPELYFGEAWIYYITVTRLCYARLCQRATDQATTVEAMSPKEVSSECKTHTAHISKSNSSRLPQMTSKEYILDISSLISGEMTVYKQSVRKTNCCSIILAIFESEEL